MLTALLLPVLAVGVARAGLTTQGCTQTPTSDDNNVVQDGQSFTLTCQFSGDHVFACRWFHYSPIIDNPNENSDHYLADCTFATGQNTNPGTADCQTRFTGSTSTSSCSITVSNTNNEDTGVWKMVAYGGNDNQVSTPSKEFEVHTFNHTSIAIVDQNRNPVTSIQTSYNWNDREEDWEDGKGGYENIQLYCQAFGARPSPTFKWYVGNQRGSPISGGDNVFKLTDPTNHKGALTRSYGRNGIIKDMESSIDFAINQELLAYLKTQNIETNPEQGNFNFDLTCEVDQPGYNNAGGNSGPHTVTFQVAKSYDNGALKSSTIGIIVGVVCAVVLLVIAMGLLLFARSRNMWCFDEYSDANDPRSRPQQGGVPAAKPAQGPRGQYRR